MTARSRRLSILGFCTAVLVGGCSRNPPTTGTVGGPSAPTTNQRPAPSIPAIATIARAAGAAGATAVDPDGGTDDDLEPLFSAAREGDPLELARLADRAGPFRLADAATSASASAERRRSAILALAFVDDVSPAIEVLTAAAVGSDVALASAALGSLLQATERRRPVEDWSPDGYRWCAEALLTFLPHVTELSRRQLLIRTLRQLAERDALSAERIPPQ